MKVERHTSRKSYEDFWAVRLENEEDERLKKIIKKFKSEATEPFDSTLLDRFSCAEHTKYDKEDEKSVLIRHSDIPSLISEYVYGLMCIATYEETINLLKEQIEILKEQIKSLEETAGQYKEISKIDKRIIAEQLMKEIFFRINETEDALAYMAEALDRWRWGMLIKNSWEKRAFCALKGIGTETSKKYHKEALKYDYRASRLESKIDEKMKSYEDTHTKYSAKEDEFYDSEWYSLCLLIALKHQGVIADFPDWLNDIIDRNKSLKEYEQSLINKK